MPNIKTLITPIRLKQFASKGKPTILKGITDNLALFEHFDIISPLRVQHCLAQLAHESASFKTTREYASGQAYEWRKDLGNIHKGDGKRYRGRGLIQLTGRANYIKAGQELDHPYVDTPMIVEQFPHALLVSLWFWNSRNLNVYADKDDIFTITRRINGGLNGLRERQTWLRKAKEIFQ